MSTKIVSSLASILHTFGIHRGGKVHMDGSFDPLQGLLRDEAEHPYSFSLGSADGIDGDIPGRIFSYCSGGIVLSIFPVFGLAGDTWTDRTSSFCLTCAAKYRPSAHGIQCRARGFYVSQDTRTVQPAPFHGRVSEPRQEKVLQVAIPG